MPRKKKTEEVKVVDKAATVAEEPVVAEEPAEKKTTRKTTTTVKKATPRKTTKKVVEPTVEFVVEFNGVQESYTNIVENVKKSYLAENEGAVINDVKIYLKPEDSKAYCVINGDINYEIDVYFC